MQATCEAFMLRSQVYSLVRDQTEADKQLDELQRNHQVRRLLLPTAADEYAFVLPDQYRANIAKQKAAAQASSRASQDLLHVFDWFQHQVALCCLEDTIARVELRRLLGNSRVTDAHISLLVNSGLLARHPVHPDSLTFAMAGIGPAIKSLVKGRKDLTGMLSRRRHPEMFVKELQTKKLSQTVLDVRFHIRDMVGSGMLQQLDSTSGPLLRLVKKHL
eukprot:jgi/Astpho2/6049/e_gw1.00084.122.1_t